MKGILSVNSYIFEGSKEGHSNNSVGILSGASIDSGKLTPVLTISSEGRKLFKKKGRLRSIGC